MTPSSWSPLAVGVIASIGGALVMMFGTWFNRNQVQPRARRALHRGPDISGTWTWFDTTSTEPVGDVKILQSGYRVTGVLKRHRSTTGETIHRIFEFEGKFLERQFFVMFEESGRPGPTNAGVISMKLSAPGNTMRGMSVYLEHDVNKVTSHDFKFTRVK